MAADKTGYLDSIGEVARYWVPCSGMIDCAIQLICCGDIGSAGSPEAEAEKNWPRDKRQMVMDEFATASAKQS